MDTSKLLPDLKPGETLIMGKSGLEKTSGWHGWYVRTFTKGDERVRQAVTAAINANAELAVKLSHLDDTVYDRTAFSQETEETLSPKLKTGREAVMTAKQDFEIAKTALTLKIAELNFDPSQTLEALRTNGNPDYEALWQAYLAAKNSLEDAEALLATEEVRFAQTLGRGFKALNAGCSGSYLGLNRMGKPRLVFKPAGEDSLSGTSPSTLVNIKLIVKNLFFKPRFVQKTAHLAEVATYQVSRLLGTNVPHTSIQTFESPIFAGDKTTEGSCQIFREGCTNLDEALKEKKELTAEELQKTIILTQISGDPDGHGGNTLYEKATNLLIKIDNGMGYPLFHTVHKWIHRYQNAWKTLPQSEPGFGDHAKGVLQGVQEDQVIAAVSKVYGTLKTSQKIALGERFRALKKAVDKGISPRVLAEVITQEEYTAFLAS